MTTYKLTGSVLSMATGKQTIDTTVETDMDLTGKMSINQLVTLGILPEGTTDDMAMADVTVTKMLTVEVVDWAAAKKLSDVIDYIKVNHPELVTVSSVARTGGGSTLTIAERAEAGYYSKYNLVKNSKTGEIMSVYDMFCLILEEAQNNWESDHDEPWCNLTRDEQNKKFSEQFERHFQEDWNIVFLEENFSRSFA